MSYSEKLQKQAEQYLIGGISAGWNSFPVSGPIRFKKAEGVYLIDVEDNEYIDWTVGWGSLMLGHNPEVLKEAMLEAFDHSFGLQFETEKHIELACETGLPLFLHERDAHDKQWQILQHYRDDFSAAVIHCFTGSKQQAYRYLDLDLSIGITGWICDERRGLELQQLVGAIPLEQLMLEPTPPI